MKAVTKLPKFVLQDWLGTLNFKRQTVILMSIRGPDFSSSTEIKKITKWIRSIALRNADPAKDYMEVTDILSIAEIKKSERFAVDGLSVHFIHHLCDALSVIGYKHPNTAIRGKALDLYYGISHYIGLLPRDADQFEERLVDMSRTKGGE